MYRVKTEFTGLPGMPGLNQLYFDATGGTATEATVAAAGFWRACQAAFSSSCVWNTLADVEVVDSATGQIVGVSSGGAESGLGVDNTDYLPTATQGLIRLRTGVFVNGREVRGRIFVPGLTEGDTADGQLASAAEVILQDALTAVITVPPVDLLVYSRKNGVAHPVVAGSVWNQFAVLRSRRD